ncbi:MAG TPA: hypothetical protein VHD56_11765, partial [Tepidisphaeraceae bacterium]|nr:hypothetical protein [Tepidisphaeraceae bacterium]
MPNLLLSHFYLEYSCKQNPLQGNHVAQNNFWIIGLYFIMLPGGIMLSAPTTEPGTVNISVRSVHITRNNELQRSFRNRYSGDSSIGTHIELLMKMSDIKLLPITRDALNIDTFVDDTYQNLIANGGDYTQQNSQAYVSDDGSMALLSINSNRAPTNEAGRVFVRGSINARIVRGELKSAKSNLAMKVGESTKIGPFKLLIRSIPDNRPP